MKYVLSLIFGIMTLNATAQSGFKPFKHYTDRMAEFALEPAIDSTQVVMLGNSLTEFGKDWNDLLGTVGVRNRGIASDTAMGIVHRLGEIAKGRPKAIFLCVGINDLSHALSPSEVFRLCRQTIEEIRRQMPATRLYVQSLLPFNESFNRWKTLTGRSHDVTLINGMLADYCEKEGLAFVNLYPQFVYEGTEILRKELTKDGLHLSPLGYDVWAAELRPYFRQLRQFDF